MSISTGPVESDFTRVEPVNVYRGDNSDQVRIRDLKDNVKTFSYFNPAESRKYVPGAGSSSESRILLVFLELQRVVFPRAG